MSHVTNTRRLVYIALLSAISFALSYFKFPLLPPPVNFLEVDFTILPILIGCFMFGLSTGFIILIVRSILWLIINPGPFPPNTYIGLPMNFVAIAIFMVLLWFFMQKKFSTSRYLLSAILGTLAFTAAMLILNKFYAIPLYSTVAHFDFTKIAFAGISGVNAYLLAVLIFNLIEGVIFSVAFLILYWALRGSKAVKFINAN
ncbi:MAG: ECF transporter S component [Streptococcaceae bacterium]|nr:ECF transporter S component [Streptococcaceae bacterium]